MKVISVKTVGLFDVNVFGFFTNRLLHAVGMFGDSSYRLTEVNHVTRTHMIVSGLLFSIRSTVSVLFPKARKL